MSFEATLIYSESTIRQAVFLFWRRTVGVSFIFVLLAIIAWFVFLLARGDRSWLLGVTGTIIAVGILMSVGVYFVHFRNSMTKFRDMGSPKAILRLEDLTFTFVSDIGESTMQWSVIKELWRFENVWLLLFSKAHFSTLPLENLPAEMRTFIVERILANGGKIS
jgi:hypothetical protein